jgi:superfamily II DNA/RNA helicase
MGFIPDVERIAKLTPFTRQTLFYSATMPPEIKRITDQFLQAPVQVEVSPPATAAPTITQTAVTVPGGEWSKRETLRRLIREEGVKNAIVFCNRKRDVDTLAQSLQKHGFSAAALHGDLDQSVRTRTLDAFRAGEIAILVASDVAARGLDIPAVSHIFNFDVPRQPDDYVHRIGRTGRAGRQGDALTLVARGEEKYLSAIENLLGKNIERRRMEGLPEELPRSESTSRRSPRERIRGRDRDRRDSKKESKTVMAERAAPSPAPEKSRETQRVSVSVQLAGTNDANQLPAFLMRPVPLPPRPAKKFASAEVE